MIFSKLGEFLPEVVDECSGGRTTTAAAQKHHPQYRGGFNWGTIESHHSHTGAKYTTHQPYDTWSKDVLHLLYANILNTFPDVIDQHTT